MPEKEPNQFELEESRIRELRQRIIAFREARGIMGDIDDMSDEQFEEMTLEVIGVDNDLGADSVDIIVAMIADEDDEGYVREPRRPVPGSDAGSLALAVAVESSSEECSGFTQFITQLTELDDADPLAERQYVVKDVITPTERAGLDVAQKNSFSHFTRVHTARRIGTIPSRPI